MRLAWIRIRKRPLIAVAVLLFIAIIAMALCSLYRGKDNAHEHYIDICNTIPRFVAILRKSAEIRLIIFVFG